MVEKEVKKEEITAYRLNVGQRIYAFLRTVIDFLAALIGIILLSPLLVGICIAVKCDSKGPVLFKQKRVGIHKKHFYIYKFRTMYIDAPHNLPTHLLQDSEQYITRVGKFLRKTSLDELPQLFNVLFLQMSVCGPRPALYTQEDLLAERDRYGANDVKPGITGWAQVHGRDELEIEEKAYLDGYYTKHFGPVIDIKCFLKTLTSVLKHEGVVEGGTGRTNNE